MGEAYGEVRLGDLELESGQVLPSVRLAYSITGRPRPDGSNVVVVCHALTGSHHVHGPKVEGLPDAWWDGVVGPGMAIDTDRYCVICFNNLCSPYGSTSPMSQGPHGGPYGMRFPLVSCRDVARSQVLGLRALGVERGLCVVGGSMGGMVALEMALSYPRCFERCVVIAAPLRLYPQAIGYNEVQRQAIMGDPDWRGGDYYPGPGPVRGLANARMLAMITYRSEKSFASRWMRDMSLGSPHSWDGRFQVESYLHHHGQELVKRFDANCYLYLTRAMDLHDALLGRGGPNEAFGPLSGRHLLAVGISSDMLFPNWQVEEIHRCAREAGINSWYEEIDSPNGHDAFLIDLDQVDEILRTFWRVSGMG
ncbi:homoserine O-acetyltransferase MetX [Thermanaerovibrio acidaminovorans]|jgi:homoserine O-acetyltransferase|uniref:Homoserine O-acetyltransferase n=1 Tax=Thermanaerovibrio acidaminovorans (strain ATCC 49978 / DSM 6589 / Su883) TaxID=525903 RepID=D1B6T6_THEAS|nr:homoserine O-acetyltransferase [Thermanaerovibrio acidaminovorans]ACZ19727.1 homoserine O-acetyltransferase [Thermanaerovibrio acidaminovorans DSM 6589]